MDDCLHASPACVNCTTHFVQLRPHITEVFESKHFRRDMPGFDPAVILDCGREYEAHLHKYEGKVGGARLFRALIDHTHILYAVDGGMRLVLLRAFKNFKEYEKFLEDKKGIQRMLESA